MTEIPSPKIGINNDSLKMRTANEAIRQMTPSEGIASKKFWNKEGIDALEMMPYEDK